MTASEKKPIEENFSGAVYATLQLDPVCIRYSVRMSPGEVLAFAKADRGYNEYDPAHLVELVHFIDGLVPRRDYGPDNPNTGSTQFEFDLGNEGSRVVYIRIPKAPFSLVENSALISQIIEWGIEHGCDDHRLVDARSTDMIFRLWWD